MNAGTRNLVREARQLQWAWLAVTSAAAVSLMNLRAFHSDFISLLGVVVPLGAFVGIPLLAALAFGSEFQHRTLTLLYAQPISRADIWRDKLLVTIAAVSVPAALFYFGLRHSGNIWALAFIWMALTTAAGACFTILSRTTIGGLVLNCSFHALLLVGWYSLADELQKSGYPYRPFVAFTLAVLALYFVFLVWLGRRMTLRLQAVEKTHSADSVLTGGALLPEFVSEWFRVRPHNAVLNLIRREFYILRSVWTLGLVCSVAWLALIIFHKLPTERLGYLSPLAPLVISLSIVIAVLAGVLSLGEEKTWGTHALQLTLPTPVFAQWLTKLLVALFTSLVSGVVLPMAVLLINGWLGGTPIAHLSNVPLWVWPAEAAFITAVAFWCSCATKGTVRAALCTFPLMFFVGFVFQLGYWPGQQIGRPLARALKHLATTHPSLEKLTYVGRGLDSRMFLIVLLPLLIVGTIQSYELFRAQEDGSRRRFGVLVPLAVTAAACGFAVALLESVAWFGYLK